MLHARACEKKQRANSAPAEPSIDWQREPHPPTAAASQRNSQWNYLHSAFGNQVVLRMISGQGAWRAQAEGGDPDRPTPTTPTPLDGGAGGPSPAALPKATLEEFRTGGNTDPDNCCALCPETLGVGRSGTASNGMEMRFRIDGHRAGVGYDILRTRATSFWETGHAGAADWTMVDSEPMGTNDDHTNDDECLIPNKSKIFVMDRPGFNLATPIAGGSLADVKGKASDADAKELVLKFNFAEWVSAKDFAAGGNWQVITSPTFTFWHAIVWLTRDASNNWQLDAGRSEIARGSILADMAKAPGA